MTRQRLHNNMVKNMIWSPFLKTDWQTLSYTVKKDLSQFHGSLREHNNYDETSDFGVQAHPPGSK